MTWKQWLYSLVDSILNGIALAGVSFFVIPKTTGELFSELGKLWIVALGGAIIGLLNHLRQSPISKISVGLIFAVAVSVVLFLPMTACAMGPKVELHILTWDANSESDLAGYYAYWKTPTGTYLDTNRVQVAVSSTPTYDLLNLSLGPGTYLFVVTAFDTSANESGPSNEVSWDASYPAATKNANITK